MYTLRKRRPSDHAFSDGRKGAEPVSAIFPAASRLEGHCLDDELVNGLADEGNDREVLTGK